jgi:signal-transduction protein with cAMP-binding, CBS, and nucleotidyltransferase domain
VPGRVGGTASQYPGRQFVFRQGDAAVTLYYIVSGTVKVAFNSENGKEAVIAILGAGDFFGEGMYERGVVTPHDDHDHERLRDRAVRSGTGQTRA